MGTLSWSKTPWTDRFWKNVPVPIEDECMQWMGKPTRYGYGQARVPWKQHQTGAHAVMWAIVNGPIPDGKVVRHKCDNRICVRPDHLEIGSQRDNVQDCIERGRFKIGGAKTTALIKENVNV